MKTFDVFLREKIIETQVTLSILSSWGLTFCNGATIDFTVKQLTKIKNMLSVYNLALRMKTGKLYKKVTISASFDGDLNISIKKSLFKPRLLSEMDSSILSDFDDKTLFELDYITTEAQ